MLRSPQYRIDATTVSPKLVDLYKQVRVKLLPVVARRLYADAKGQYDLAMYVQAQGGFVRLLDLLEEAGAAGAGDSVSDLAQLANGFLELTNLALARAKEPPAVTVEAAHALNDEARRGHLAPGTLGDVTIMSGDVTAGTPDEIRALEVVATIVAGAAQYCGDPEVCSQFDD